MFYMSVQHVCGGECIIDGRWDVWGSDVWHAEFLAAEYHDVHEFSVRVPVLWIPSACVGVCDHGGYGGLPDLVCGAEVVAGVQERDALCEEGVCGGIRPRWRVGRGGRITMRPYRVRLVRRRGAYGAYGVDGVGRDGHIRDYSRAGGIASAPVV